MCMSFAHASNSTLDTSVLIYKNPSDVKTSSYWGVGLIKSPHYGLLVVLSLDGEELAWVCFPAPSCRFASLFGSFAGNSTVLFHSLHPTSDGLQPTVCGVLLCQLCLCLLRHIFYRVFASRYSFPYWPYWSTFLQAVCTSCEIQSTSQSIALYIDKLNSCCRCIAIRVLIFCISVDTPWNTCNMMYHLAARLKDTQLLQCCGLCDNSNGLQPRSDGLQPIWCRIPDGKHTKARCR